MNISEERKSHLNALAREHFKHMTRTPFQELIMIDEKGDVAIARFSGGQLLDAMYKQVRISELEGK